eukprot:6618639-Prymnesium_polylepis.1
MTAPGTPIPNPSPSWTEITDVNMLSQLALVGTMVTNSSGAVTAFVPHVDSKCNYTFNSHPYDVEVKSVTWPPRAAAAAAARPSERLDQQTSLRGIAGEAFDRLLGISPQVLPVGR